MPLPLICFPFAGAGPSFFAPWRRYRLEVVDLVLAEVPGRERLIDRPAHQEVEPLVAEVAESLKDLFAASQEHGVAVFGHSLGAVLAFEAARLIESQGLVPLAHVFVSGSPGPATRRENRATGLDDERFLAKVEELSGYHHAAFDDDTLRSTLLPTLRADVLMHENYLAGPGTRIAAPITAIRGRDDTLVSQEQAREWAGFTQSRFAYAEMPGGHLYLRDVPGPLLHLVQVTIRKSAAS
jgi:surfactin synthase thioesterase subunit